MTVNIKGKTLLLIVAAGGTIITAYLAAKNTPEAQKRKEAALQEKREKTGDESAQLTFVESAKAQVGAYVPAIVSGTVVLGSLIGSEVINKENLKKAEKAFDEYKEMTEKLDGKGASKVIEKAIEQKKLDEKAKKPWDEKQQFRIVFQGHSIMFEKTRAEVIEAIYELNRYFHERGVVCFNEFLRYLDQSPIPEGDDRGWEAYIGESMYGYSWIDFGLKECEDEPWVTEIYMAVYPHFLDEEAAEEELEMGVKKLDSGLLMYRVKGTDEEEKKE